MHRKPGRPSTPIDRVKKTIAQAVLSDGGFVGIFAFFASLITATVGITVALVV